MKRLLRATTITLGVVVVALMVVRLTVTKAPSPFGKVNDFTFTDQNGHAFGLKDLKGKTWVADFVFTRCLGPCPMLTTRMSELQNEFKKGVTFVSFSVDPGYDTPPVLAAYAKTYGADPERWHFLTGPREQLFTLIQNNFHLAVGSNGKEKPSPNDVLHSTYFVLVDGKGNIRGYYNSTDAESMKELRKALS